MTTATYERHGVVDTEEAWVSIGYLVSNGRVVPGSAEVALRMEVPIRRAGRLRSRTSVPTVGSVLEEIRRDRRDRTIGTALARLADGVRELADAVRSFREGKGTD